MKDKVIISFEKYQDTEGIIFKNENNEIYTAFRVENFSKNKELSKMLFYKLKEFQNNDYEIIFK